MRKKITFYIFYISLLPLFFWRSRSLKVKCNAIISLFLIFCQQREETFQKKRKCKRLIDILGQWPNHFFLCSACLFWDRTHELIDWINRPRPLWPPALIKLWLFFSSLMSPDRICYRTNVDKLRNINGIIKIIPVVLLWWKTAYIHINNVL